MLVLIIENYSAVKTDQDLLNLIFNYKSIKHRTWNKFAHFFLELNNHFRLFFFATARLNLLHGVVKNIFPVKKLLKTS